VLLIDTNKRKSVIERIKIAVPMGYNRDLTRFKGAVTETTEKDITGIELELHLKTLDLAHL
jgi:hypothetical protein